MKHGTGGADPSGGGDRGVLFFFFTKMTVLAPGAEKVPVVSKWGRFEHSFQSSLSYSNALQDVTLSVVFTSPLGETNQVYGFWDGGKTWLVRFSPNLPGRWTFKSSCSDIANRGLN